ncbi:MAG: tRNA epoxyqueuosine(34) reductase QueG [bacterium]|nr:tRNA epoxyqueuosine(34) reductase QueG [bacterium]
MDDRRDRILSYGKQLGFDLLRISSIDLSSHYHQKYRQWISAGFHADMRYMERRIGEGDAIRERMGDARSMISVAMNYHREESYSPDRLKGRVSRYAVTRDYHKVIGNRLKKLAVFIRTELGGGARYYVDTGPILERAYGEVSGVGYIGKNTMLISEGFGSWILLGVVFTDLELSVDTNELSIRCGSCTKCIDDCPTGAILDGGVIDSGKCISYLTIENRGPVPLSYRKAVGNWIFGCDICQEVCPHNGRARVCGEGDFRVVRFSGGEVSIRGILELETDEVFVERFKGTPVMRARRRGLQRNACVVAGNSGDRALIQVLREFIDRTDDNMLIEHAQWAIDELTKPQPSCP